MVQNRKKPGSILGLRLLAVGISAGMGILAFVLAAGIMLASNLDLWISTTTGFLLGVIVGILIWLVSKRQVPPTDQIWPNMVTTATIRRRFKEEHLNRYGETYFVYNLEFEFQAQHTDRIQKQAASQITILSENMENDKGQTPITFTTMILNAKIDSVIYNRFGPGDSITLRYSSEDPRIVLLDGEY